jgi:hypothetical protein
VAILEPALLVTEPAHISASNPVTKTMVFTVKEELFSKFYCIYDLTVRIQIFNLIIIIIIQIIIVMKFNI